MCFCERLFLFLNRQIWEDSVSQGDIVVGETGVLVASESDVRVGLLELVINMGT